MIDSRESTPTKTPQASGLEPASQRTRESDAMAMKKQITQKEVKLSRSEQFKLKCVLEQVQSEYFEAQQKIDDLQLELEGNRDARKLCSELEELTRKAEEDAARDRQEMECFRREAVDLRRVATDLQAQVENLTQRLNEVTASNEDLQEIVRNAIEQASPSAHDIQADDEGDSTKMLQHIRRKYLEKVTEIHDLREKHRREKDELNKQFDSAKLKSSIRAKDIQSLSLQLQTFQQVASQREQLQEHSKTQITIVVKLRKELEAARVNINFAHNYYTHMLAS